METRIHIARSPEDRKSAFRLLHDSYVSAGLQEPSEHRLRVLPFHLLADTLVLVARTGDEITSTATLIPDSHLGVPSDSQFPRDLARLRERWIAEVSCLAGTQDGMLVPMFGLLVQAAEHQGVERLVLSVHPDHAKTYVRLFGCHAVAFAPKYSLVNGKPAVLCYHDLRCDCPMKSRMYKTIYRPDDLEPSPMTSEEVVRYSMLVK